MAGSSEPIQYHTIDDFRFKTGDVRSVGVAYRSINAGKNKKALIPTCYGGRIDTTLSFCAAPCSSLSDYHVIVVAMLGNGESSSPSNSDDFPEKLDYTDQVHAQYALVTHLGFEKLDVVLGFSMGGQQAYYWAAMYPDFVGNAVAICSSAHTSSHNYAFLEGPLSALIASHDYDGGNYRAKKIIPVAGLRAFQRAYTAWLYSADWYRQDLWKKVSGKSTMAEFMDARQDGKLDWDAQDLIILGRQWQAGNVGTVGGDYESTLSTTIKARFLVMPGGTDQYFRHEDSEVEVKLLQRGELAVIPSVWGHAAGGGASQDDNVWMDNRIRQFLASQ